MTELQIINHLLCSGCNKPPERIIVRHDYDRNAFVVETFCCYCKEFVLPFLDSSILGLGIAIHYGALSVCCDYISGVPKADTPTATDWQLVGKLFDNAFSPAKTGPVFCTCGSSSVGSARHSVWCDLFSLLND